MEDEHSTECFHEIVGESPAFTRMLKSAMEVALADDPLLILGEAGSGKESIARAIHRISARRKESFVKVICAAPADGMLERKLFGLEQQPSVDPADGTFGQLESAGLDLANHGILFLDEIAHVPLDVQGKLLRLLDHGEFERLGGTRIIHVNVRSIATTRYDLGKRVAGRKFRADLCDRLNESILRVPPLRDRRDDIPLLARYFMQKFARRSNKHIESISDETMNSLMNSNWTGNVRQLELLIERSVALTDGPVLRVPDFGQEQDSKVASG